MKVYAYRIRDKKGNKRDVVVMDYGDEVHVEGLEGCNPFEAEAYYLEGWAEQYGLTLDRFEVEIDFDSLTANLIFVNPGDSR